MRIETAHRQQHNRKTDMTNTREYYKSPFVEAIRTSKRQKTKHRASTLRSARAPARTIAARARRFRRGRKRDTAVDYRGQKSGRPRAEPALHTRIHRTTDNRVRQHVEPNRAPALKPMKTSPGATKGHLCAAHHYIRKEENPSRFLRKPKACSPKDRQTSPVEHPGPVPPRCSEREQPRRGRRQPRFETPRAEAAAAAAASGAVTPQAPRSRTPLTERRACAQAASAGGETGAEKRLQSFRRNVEPEVAGGDAHRVLRLERN